MIAFGRTGPNAILDMILVIVDAVGGMTLKISLYELLTYSAGAGWPLKQGF